MEILCFLGVGKECHYVTQYKHKSGFVNPCIKVLAVYEKI